jgi:hypothetical protein
MRLFSFKEFFWLGASSLLIAAVQLDPVFAQPSSPPGDTSKPSQASPVPGPTRPSSPAASSGGPSSQGGIQQSTSVSQEYCLDGNSIASTRPRKKLSLLR